MSLSIRLFMRSNGWKGDCVRIFEYDPEQPGVPHVYVQGSFAIIEMQGGARFIFPADQISEIVEEPIS